MAKTRSTSPSAALLPRGPRLAVAIRLTHATEIARFLIWTGKSAIPNPNALAGVIVFICSIHPGGCALGSGALKRFLRSRTTSRVPTTALMTRWIVEAASPAAVAPAKRVSPAIPIAADSEVPEAEGQNGELREKVAHGDFLRLSILPQGCLVMRHPTLSVLWQGVHAYEWKPQATYAVEDPMEVGLVYYLPRYNGLSIFYVYLHTFEGLSKPLGEFALHHYSVEHSSTPVGP